MITHLEPKNIKPYYPTVIDIETTPSGALLDIGFTHQDYRGKLAYDTFTTWGSFTTHLLRLISEHRHNSAVKYRLTHIYAHNGNGFDWLSYLRYLLDHSAIKDFNVMLSEQLIIGIIIIFHTGDRVYLCDSLRLMPYALKTIAEVMNEDHKKIYIGPYITKMDEFRERERTAYYHYLQEDCAALQEALYRFWSKIYALEGSIGYLPLTLPALALRIFRKGLEGPITTPWNDKVREFTRRAYTGGRVECYRPGSHEVVNVYDVNSMYPFMMYSQEVPISHRCYWSSVFDPNTLGFWEITYEQQNRSLPAILRDEATNDFTYSGSGVFHTQEVNLLLSNGDARVSVNRGCVFPDTGVLFRSFVEKYYTLRQEAKASGDQALDFISKILMNSLYGKFGQRSTKKRIELANNERLHQYLQNGTKVRVIEDFVIIEEDDPADHEFVAIAATITATARVNLYHYIIQNPDAYIYADTDSVHLASATLPESGGLGGLKLEANGSGIYLGKKLYTVGDKVKAKGVGRAVRSGKLDRTTFERLIDPAESIEIESETMPTLRGVLYLGQTPCKMITRKRTLRRTTLLKHE